MNNLQVFKNEKFGTVRTITENGSALFCGADVAKALGYARPNEAISKHCKGTLKRRIGVRTGNRADGTPAMQSVEMLFIPEGDIYRLAARSKLPGADEFERWIFDEVLVSVNHHGAYMTPETIERMLGDPDAMIKVLTALKEERERCKALAPDAEYAQNCLLAENGIVTSSIAKDYGMSADSFNKLLKGLKIQYKRGGQWLLYAPYQAEGYMVSKTTPITHSDGRVELKVTSLWTAEGRKFLYDFLKERGILPLNERGRA